MGIISILVLVGVGIYIVFEMNKAQNILKNQWFQQLDRNDKIKITAFLKNFWKKNITLISLLICWVFIIISTFLGKGTKYQGQVCELAIFCSIISIVILIISKKKYYNNVNNYKKVK